MILKEIIYSDSAIKVYFIKTERDEIKAIAPDLVQYITICYSIGLIDNPGSIIKESVKIDKKDIGFMDKYIITSIQLDRLLKPYDCQITIHSINIFLKDSQRFKIDIKKTKQFRNIKSGSPIIPIPPNKNSKSFKKTIKIENRTSLNTPSTPTLSTPKSIKEDCKKEGILKQIDKRFSNSFIDSYKKFKKSIQNTDLIKFIKLKTSTIDFSLKHFGMSLFCKLLLMVKYLNILVDNEFQTELNEFLKNQILNGIIMEEAID